jgi:hypothetical protein
VRRATEGVMRAPARSQLGFASRVETSVARRERSVRARVRDHAFMTAPRPGMTLP